MKTALERELKFEGADVPLEKLGGTSLEGHTFTTTYYDTADRRLTRVGITLRHRQEAAAGTWQVKLPGGVGRVELEEAGGPVSPPGSVEALLAGVLRGAPLEPLATMRTHRRGRRVNGVDVTVDDVEILEGSHLAGRFTEIEAELVDGSPAALARVGRNLRKLGASEVRIPKLFRAVDPPGGREPKRAAPSLEHLRAMIAAQYEQLLRNDPIVRLRDDADSVHDMRVAVRRLRSILRSAAEMLDEDWVRAVRGELDWLGGKLGAVRDLDVSLAKLEAEAAELDGGDAAIASVLLHPLREDRARARQRLLAALDKPRYHELLDVLASSTASLPVTQTRLSPEQMARKEFKKLRRRARHLDRLDDAALHKVRIQGKRARYAAELATATPGGKAARFVSAAKELQDTLGAHQDAVLALRLLRELARRSDRTDTALIAGRLIERQRREKRRARRKVPGTWRRVDRSGRRAWA